MTATGRRPVACFVAILLQLTLGKKHHPDVWHICAHEGELCPCNGTVVYGQPGHWSRPRHTQGATKCSMEYWQNASSGEECRCHSSAVSEGDYLDHNSSSSARLLIITPTCRPQNLQFAATGMRWELVLYWVVGHMPGFDFSKLPQIGPPSKIVHVGGTNLPSDFVIASLGNSLRNLVLLNYMPIPRNYFVFFLDDDNIVHPSMWELLPSLARNQPRVYTFDQWRKGEKGSVELLTGDVCGVSLFIKYTYLWSCPIPNLQIGHMDTSSHLIHASYLADSEINTWDVYASTADGIFIEKICKKYSHTYIPLVLSYYNALYNKDMQRESRDALVELGRKALSGPRC